MFAKLFALASVVATFGVVAAGPNPLEPSDTSVYKVGEKCHITWEPDTTGAWKTMYISLMTGDNYDMVHLTTVAKVDGTTTSSYDWTCPDVTMYSRVYFYEFTSPSNASDEYWTTRFVIAQPDGTTTPPPNATQPETGEEIPWGTGALADPSTATPPPDLSGAASSGSAVVTPTGAASSGSASISATNSAASGMSTSRASSTRSASALGASGSSTPGTAPSDTSAAVGVRAWVATALTVAAGVAAFAL